MRIGNFFRSSINDLRETAQRFPFSIIAAFCLFLLKLDDIYKWNLIDDSTTERLVPTLIAGFFWFGGAKLFFESRGRDFREYLAVSTGVFIVIAYWIFQSEQITPSILFLLGGLITFVTVAPFLSRNATDSAFYNFNRELCIGTAYAILLSIIFCTGLSAIVVTIRELFGVDFGYRTYSTIWAFGALFLAPFYALSWVSKDFKSDTEAHIPKGINFMLSYLLVPFCLVYFIIIYAYAAKILLLWELPQGKLSAMICGFGIAGILTQLAAYPLRESGKLPVRLFHKYFCRAFLPLIFLLFLAVYVRINAYGVTESRYAIVLAGLWFTATTLIYIRRRDNFSMKYGPAILAALLVLASFGPWGAESISAKSQVSRLEALLLKNGILQDGKVIKTDENVEIEDRRTITSIVGYLTNSEKLSYIKPWFAEDANIHSKEINKYSSSAIMDDLGVASARSKHYYSDEDTHTGIFRLYAVDNEVIEVKGYDFITNRLYISTDHKKTSPCPDSGHLTFTLDNNTLTVTRKEASVTFNLAEPVLNSIKEKATDAGYGSYNLKQPLELSSSSGKLAVKLIIYSADGKGYGVEGKSLEITNLSITALIKEK